MRSAVIMLVITLLLYMPINVAEAGQGNIRLIGSYWGQNGVREEVAPGDGGARLTIALTNDYDEDRISGIRGELRLPSVMRSQSLATPSIVEAHYAGVVPPGGVFELTFLVNIDGSAEVGIDYTAYLTLIYHIEDDRTLVHTIPVKINIPGRPVLKVSLNETTVEPGRINYVRLTLFNDGTARASDIRVVIQPQVQPGVGLVLEEQPWVLAALPAGGKAERVVRVYASQSTADSVIPFTVTTSYRNTVGSYVELVSTLSLHVQKPPVGEAYIRVYSEPVRLEPGSTEHIPIVIENIGSVEVRDVRIWAEQAGLPVSIVGRATWFVRGLEPGGRVVIEAQVSTGQAAANGVYQLPLQVRFKDPAGNTLASLALVAVSVGDIPPKAPNLLIESDPRVIAGKTQEARLLVKNIYSGELRRVSITVQPLTQRLTVVGSNNWLAESLRPGSVWEIPMRLYAEPELAGTPAAIRVSATYVMSDRGEQASEQREVGFVVEGYIDLRIYDLRVVLVGGEPYLSGNILNEGIADALFATVSIRSGGGIGNEAFIGEIKPNAPLPFNIKLGPVGSHFAGELVVKYKDVLRRDYVSSFEVEVDVPRPVTTERREVLQPTLLTAILLAALAAAALIAAVLRGRGKRRESG